MTPSSARSPRACAPVAAARPSACAALLGLAAIACAAPIPARVVPASQATPAHIAVKEQVRAYYDDLSARDWEALAGHFWPGAQLATIWQAQGQERPQVNAVSIEDFVERGPAGPGAQPVFEARLLEAEVRVFGSLAQVWAHHETRFGSPEQLVTVRGVDAFSLLRHDGRWRITSIAYATEG